MRACRVLGFATGPRNVVLCGAGAWDGEIPRGRDSGGHDGYPALTAGTRPLAPGAKPGKVAATKLEEPVHARGTNPRRRRGLRGAWRPRPLGRQEVLTQQVETDVDFEGWARATGTLAARFIDFLRGQERMMR
jgi:hypothetical protein